LLPAYVLSYVVDSLLGYEHTYYNSYRIFSHLIAFGCGLISAHFIRRIVYLGTKNEESANWGISLLLMPPWLGYSLFNYKDMPVAVGLAASVYFAILYARGGDWRTAAAFFAALLWLGTQKLAAMPLALPACACVAIATLRHPTRNRIGVVAVQATIFILLLYISTPPAWTTPFEFVTTNLQYMSHHAWSGCTLTAGECIGRGSVERPNLYSPLRYMGLWYSAQMPLLYLFMAGVAFVMYLHRAGDAVRHLLFASVCWPLIAIVWSQSTLYDGIRHTLFLVPLMIAFTFCNLPISNWSRPRPWLMAYLLFLLVDVVRLQPYSYVWFNEPTRLFASHKNYETDYWGFSLKEATKDAQMLIGPMDFVVGEPAHLVAPFNHVGKMARTVADVPLGASYIQISYTRTGTTAGGDCKLLRNVERTQLFSHKLELAFVARCTKK
jgi:hypothetical protein